MQSRMAITCRHLMVHLPACVSQLLCHLRIAQHPLQAEKAGKKAAQKRQSPGVKPPSIHHLHMLEA